MTIFCTKKKCIRSVWQVAWRQSPGTLVMVQGDPKNATHEFHSVLHNTFSNKTKLSTCQLESMPGLPSKFQVLRLKSLCRRSFCRKRARCVWRHFYHKWVSLKSLPEPFRVRGWQHPLETIIHPSECHFALIVMSWISEIPPPPCRGSVSTKTMSGCSTSHLLKCAKTPSDASRSFSTKCSPAKSIQPEDLKLAGQTRHRLKLTCTSLVLLVKLFWSILRYSWVAFFGSPCTCASTGTIWGK